jgi:hypothetical protein
MMRAAGAHGNAAAMTRASILREGEGAVTPNQKGMNCVDRD